MSQGLLISLGNPYINELSQYSTEYSSIKILNNSIIMIPNRGRNLNNKKTGKFPASLSPILYYKNVFFR